MGKVTQAQADKYGISFADLQKLAEGKDCSVYPGSTLHVRKVRGGKVVVFNTSEKARGKAISITKAAKKAAKLAAKAVSAEATI